MKQKFKFGRWIFILLLLIAAVLAYGYLRPKEDEVSYLTEAVRRGNLYSTVNATGQIGAVQLVSVGAQASGQIQRLYVEVGQEVHIGDMIAEIDSTTQENELATTQAKLESYRAQLEAKQVALRVAKADYERESQLRRSDSTSGKNLDSAESTYASVKAEVAELQSQILQTEIALSTAETNLGYTRIVAPLNGTVVSVPVEAGQTVNASQTTPTIVQVADLSRMELKIEIAEGDITKVRPGQPVTYSILSEPDQTFRAELHSIDPGLTTLSDGTYTASSSANSSEAIYYYAKALVDNSDGQLRIGMTTQNVIAVADALDILLAPSIAIEKINASQVPDGQPDTQYGRVFILNGSGQPEERIVTLGVADNMHSEIKSGLNEGDMIILSQLGRGESVSEMRMRGGFMR